MKTKRGVWAFQRREFGPGKVPPKKDPKGQMMGGGARARQERLRGSGPAAAPPEVSGRSGGSPPARASRQPPTRPRGSRARRRGAFPNPVLEGGGRRARRLRAQLHATQHGEKKARPHHCIRGHETLAGQNAGGTRHPPSLTLAQSQLPFPRKASFPSAPGSPPREAAFLLLFNCK